MFQSIIEAVLALLKAIPIFNRWFTKTPVEREEAGKTEIRDEMDHFRDTGRPQ